MIHKSSLSITLLLILITINLKAQEKQNDATWEETIDFIKEYSYLIESIKPPIPSEFDIRWSQGDFKIQWDYENLYIHLNEYKITFHTRQTGYESITEVKIPLIKIPLKIIRAFDYDLFFSKPIEIIYSKKIYSKYARQTARVIDKEYNNNIQSIHFYFTDDLDNKPRLEKALKHLVYLATEKRKKEREASGDKF